MVNQEPYDPLEEIKKSMMAEEDAMNNNILTISGHEDGVDNGLFSSYNKKKSNFEDNLLYALDNIIAQKIDAVINEKIKMLMKAMEEKIQSHMNQQLDGESIKILIKKVIQESFR
jgi:hypothetical protein